MAIRGFLFDLDGTLVDSERETAEAMARALWRGQGIAIEPYDRDFIIGRSWIAIYDSLAARYPQLAWSRQETIAQTAMLRDEFAALVRSTAARYWRTTGTESGANARVASAWHTRGTGEEHRVHPRRRTRAHR